MKKIMSAFGAVAFLALLSSCDDKVCYCYERVSPSQVNEVVVYATSDTPCASLGTSSRGCIESNERGTIDPNDIAK